ncbi:alpha/beta fold hydrolase [Dactylosporangium fulvum]|uniref:Alpha/beta fold hydrolase n=1 Tax=Dactylosporangium fulvum TaxID=53359 RepID=A0ABY5VN98_9ACTN|nr:alpha/beta fold hydrolase [Dactylosporangium fulvum]UWP79202.1 alpha/beta fold hydrolase [Dactylosporangium fulvum]
MNDTLYAGQTPWLPNRRSAADTALRLFCLPHAGGAASAFRTWQHHVPYGMEVCPVQLPGRETRFGEPLPTGIVDLVPALAEAVLPSLDVPFALLGNSMGALVAYELARYLHRHYLLSPVRLVVAAARPPGGAALLPRVSHLSDQEFGRAMQARHGGIPDEILDDPQIGAVFLPVLRADMGMVEQYRPAPGPPLTCPVSAYAGTRDGNVGAADLDGWATVTTGRFDRQVLDGDHFAVIDHPQLVIGRLADELALR